MSIVWMLLWSAPTGLLRVWVVQHLWAWFVTPTFHVATPQIAVLIGLIWLLGTSHPNPMPDMESKSAPTATIVAYSVLSSLAGLLVGAVAHGFVR